MVFDTLKDGMSTLSDFYKALAKVDESTAVSLSQYTARTRIASSMYIDNAVAREDIMKDIYGMAYQIYTGLVLSAANLGSYIAGSRTVRDAIDRVATEGFEQPYVDVNERLRGMLGMSEQKLSTEAASVVETQPKVNHHLAGGRVIRVEFANGENKFSADLHLSILPYNVSSTVMEQFVKLNNDPRFRDRFYQYRAGEISFWADLIGQRDLIKERIRALKEDRTGELHRIQNNQSSGLEKLFSKIARPERSNICTKIAVFDSNTLKKACSDVGLNFKNPNDRNKFFTKTYTMMAISVDQDYNTVTVYMHGVKMPGEYDFNTVKATGQSSKYDLVDIAKAFSSNSAPRF